MKQKISYSIISALLLASGVVAMFAPALPVQAASCIDNSKDNGVDLGVANDGDCAEKTAFSFGKCGTEQVGLECLADTVLTFMSAAVGIAVVGGITYGGVRFSMSRGNPAETQKAIQIITNSVLALVLFLLMYAIINFLIPGGVFS